MKIIARDLHEMVKVVKELHASYIGFTAAFENCQWIITLTERGQK
jgi:hypothetical protein